MNQSLDFWVTMDTVFNLALFAVSLILVTLFVELWWKRRKVKIAQVWPFRHSWTAGTAPAWIAAFIFSCGMTHVADIFSGISHRQSPWEMLAKFAAVFTGIVAAEIIYRELPELAQLPCEVDRLVAESLILKARAGKLEAMARGRVAV